mgnify:CR=1 FL=1
MLARRRATRTSCSASSRARTSPSGAAALARAARRRKVVASLRSSPTSCSTSRERAVARSATFAETAGTFVNAEGRWQSFDAAAGSRRRGAAGLARAARARQRARAAALRVPARRATSRPALERELGGARSCRSRAQRLQRLVCAARRAARRRRAGTRRARRADLRDRRAGAPLASRCRRPRSLGAGRVRREQSARAVATSLWFSARRTRCSSSIVSTCSRSWSVLVPLILGGRVLHVLGTQDPRLDARTASARTASAGKACCSRSPTCIKMLFKGDRRAGELEQVPVPDGARAVARAGVRRLGRRCRSATTSSSRTSTPGSCTCWR